MTWIYKEGSVCSAVRTEEDVRQCLLGKGDNLNCMFLYTTGT